MRKTIFILLTIMGLGFQTDIQAQTTCIDVIFPYGAANIDVTPLGCPGAKNIQAPGGTPPPVGTCTGIQISNETDYGNISIVETADANIIHNVNDTVTIGFYYYATSNCSQTDEFTIVIPDNPDCELIGHDTINYMLYLDYECETPDDVFCCIAPGDTSYLGVLANDTTFINEDYSDDTLLNIVINPLQDNTSLGSVELLPDNTFKFTSNGITGVDSFSYEVTYSILVDGETISLCDKQYCYVFVEDCLNTMPDVAYLGIGDIVCIDPLANDLLSPTLYDPVLDSIGCTNPDPLPTIDPATLTTPVPLDGGPSLSDDGNGSWCFTHTSTGIYTYEYGVCTDADECATENIVITVQPNCMLDDYIALRALYLNTNGNDWTNNTGWPNETAFLANPNTPPTGYADLGIWYGVKTNNIGCVTRLSLQGNELIGSIPQEIGNLSNLTRLYLHTNQLGGNIPQAIGNLSNLTILNMRDNQFTGNVPSEIGDLSALESLNLGANQLGGGIPLTFGNLTNLRSLLLNNNQLNGDIPSAIGNLSALESFYVHYNQLSGEIPATIGNLNNLQQVYFAHNQLSGCFDTSLSNLCNQLTYSSNARISDGNNFDAAWEDFCNSEQGVCLVPANDVCPVPDSFMLRPGDAFVTCYSDGNPANPVAVIDNIDEVEPNHAGDFANDLSTQLTQGTMFTKNEIGGEIFGTCIDNEGDIYVAATTLYGYTSTDFPTQNGYASIVKINGSTMTIDPNFDATLAMDGPLKGFENHVGSSITMPAPGTGWLNVPFLECDTTHSGLGNICYDENHGNLLVTNFEDGQIWRINKNGSVIDSYDPFAPDDGIRGFAPLGERIWGIQTHALPTGETEVYFGVWNNDRRSESSQTATCNGLPLNFTPQAENEVHRVMIDAAGNFAATSDLVFTLPSVPIDWNSTIKNDNHQPVSDIAISEDGLQIILSTRTMAGDINRINVANSDGAHHSTLFYSDRPLENSLTWSALRRFNISSQGTIGNSAGGVDFAPLQDTPDTDEGAICDRMIWATGDNLLLDPSIPNYPRVYGLQGFSTDEVLNPDPVDINQSYLIDADRNTTTQVVFKTFMGDIEVFKCDCIDCQISSTLMPTIQPDSTCCYALDLSNISVSSQAASIQIDITDPAGVFFDQSSVMTSPGFNLNNYSPTSLTIDSNGNLLPNGNNNYLRFCFGNSSPTTVLNQTFTIKYFDINGNELVDCEQELTTDCELPPADEACLDVTAVSVECDSLYGQFKFTYQVTNLTNAQILDNLDFTVVNPATGIVLSATSNPIIAPIGPGQTSTDQCIDIYDLSSGPYPKQVDIIFSATGYHQSDSSSYCCHDRLDTLSIELPDCTNCIDVVDYNIYCDSLGDYYLDFCVENNSTPPFVADELDIAKLSSTPSYLGLSQYLWNNTTNPGKFPLTGAFCETVQIIGFNPPQTGDMIDLEFRFNNIAQDSCCAEREVLNLTLECCDYIPELPDCNDCVESVQVIEYQGQDYVIYWADPLCSDALTIVYNYCDGTELCREGGFLGETQCSDLMPNLFDNYMPGQILWSKDMDCNTSTCCADPCEFFERVNAPLLTNAPNIGDCTVSITTVALNDCDQVSIDWGDGTVDGPFTQGNVSLSHEYAASGTYEAMMFVKEIADDGTTCWEGVNRFGVTAGCTGKQPEEEVSVFHNYPNPFTEQTTIEFTLTKDLSVTLLVFDSMGRQIDSLLNQEAIATGTHEVTFDGADYPSGVYYYTIQAGAFFGTQKMILTK